MSARSRNCTGQHKQQGGGKAVAKTAVVIPKVRVIAIGPGHVRYAARRRQDQQQLLLAGRRVGAERT
jgi:hypothetical protein